MTAGEGLFVVLDYTLEDLFSIDGDASNLVLVFAYPFPPTQFSSSTKFPYQAPLWPEKEKAILTLRRLHTLPLKHSFVAGKLPVLLLDPSSKENEGKGPEGASRRYHADATAVLGQLHPKQRPKLSFIANFRDLALDADHKLVVLNPLDHLAHLSHLVDPEVHYDLLSKRGLAYSGLPTPETFVAETTIGANNIYSPEKLNEEIRRMICPIDTRVLPFIVKVPQATGGTGTFIIRTESERQRAKVALQAELRLMLRDVSPVNQHLHPCCLVFQEFIPGNSVALSFFVTQKGRAIFIGCCTQLFDVGGMWTGGSICYPEQPQLEKEYAALMGQIASLLHAKGYYGAVGADILVDPSGRQLIFDLNVRSTGSFSMGCLKGHFEGRGLPYALLYSFRLRCLQNEFRRHFQNEMGDGSLIINTWTSDLPDGSSMTSISIAAPSQQELKMFLAKVKAFVTMMNA
ncbi:hypothetical protein Asppvi_005430 [Aspergillus pseudoviridinutans]|uniref:ATP-grasp domain-containing protein n=1 Tax=Aspergillus pseudoviridinutans TaxID=1517512 RepID=A0A9P3BF25_9EURO|nr:uncharacterized protein Asppvi_005430 [Aspergillus pseudoviridinutans]GIJ86541.1 hypothetical protein Asppvi_005430 [Aspergillus pseudoviridinutans]